jgi:uncharacterized membrane protein
MNARGYYRLALTAYLGLIFLTLLWEGWLAPAPKAPPGLWLMVKSLPLLLPLFGLLHGKRYTYQWSLFLILAYFTEGVVVAYAHRQAGFALHSPVPYAWLEIVLTTVFFFSAILYIRRGRAVAC